MLLLFPRKLNEIKHTETVSDVEQALLGTSLPESPSDTRLPESPGEGGVLWKSRCVISETGSQKTL